MAVISNVSSASLAEELGLETGDEIISINGNQIKDILDYRYETSDLYFELELKKKNGKIEYLKVERNYNEYLGIEFENIIFDDLMLCNNDCVFCFVKQQPDEIRKSLKLKDDDYRFSFLQGSFITLSNLKERDYEKIYKYHISPLYISVHTTNPDLRIKMMKNPKTGNIKKQLDKLLNHNIQFHAQIVLCPGINDGEELDKSINDLIKYFPSILSLGIVPVGLTKYRKSLYPLKKYNKKNARIVLKQINKWQNKIKITQGKNYIYASDEFYFLAEQSFPKYKDYNDFPQIENGIGLSKLTWYKFSKLKNSLPQKIKTNKYIIITGKLGEQVLKPMINILNKIIGLYIDILPVENYYYGKEVNVTGLLTGRDIKNVLENIEIPTNVILPGISLNKNNKFLDDLELNDLKNNFKKNNFIVCNDIDELVEVVIDE